MSAPSNTVRRAYWLKTLHQWHWISSAIALTGMLLFAFTGLTLNHSGQLDAEPDIVNHTATLPSGIQDELGAIESKYESDGVFPMLPADLVKWARQNFSVDIRQAGAEWSDRELYLSMQKPGGDAWMDLKLKSGDVTYQTSSRGWIAYLNDLHKGRYTGVAWAWFMDIFSVSCIIFSITGLLILKLHGPSRPTTWPLVGLGVLVPLLIALLLIH